MDNIKLKVFPQFKGRYFKATEFITSVRIQVDQLRLAKVDSKSAEGIQMIRVDGISLEVDKVDKKVTQLRNYATTNQVVMEVSSGVQPGGGGGVRRHPELRVLRGPHERLREDHEDDHVQDAVRLHLPTIRPTRPGKPERVPARADCDSEAHEVPAAEVPRPNHQDGVHHAREPDGGADERAAAHQEPHFGEGVLSADSDVTRREPQVVPDIDPGGGGVRSAVELRRVQPDDDSQRLLLCSEEAEGGLLQ